MRRERKARKSLNSDFEKVQFSFLKNLISEFRSVENHPRPVETDKNSLSQILKILKKFRSVEKQNGPIESGKDSPIFGKNTIFEKMR